MIDVSRFFSRVPLISSISIFASILTILASFGYDFFIKDEGVFQDALYYLTLLLLIIFLAIYLEKYRAEKEKHAGTKECLKHIHQWSDSIRSLSNLENWIIGKDAGIINLSKQQQLQFDFQVLLEDRKKFINEFESITAKVCEEIVHYFNTLGYPVHGACVKCFDEGLDQEKKQLIYVVHRFPGSERGRGTEFLDLSDLSKQPFANLLIQTYSKYHELIANTEARKVRQNRAPHQPIRYLAIGGLDRQNNRMPRLLSKIIYSTHAERYSDEAILNDLKAVVNGRYSSCMGMAMYSCASFSQMETLDRREYEMLGFIGVHSSDGNAWKYLDTRDLQGFAALADSFASLMQVYRNCVKFINTYEQYINHQGKA